MIWSLDHILLTCCVCYTHERETERARGLEHYITPLLVANADVVDSWLHNHRSDVNRRERRTRVVPEYKTSAPLNSYAYVYVLEKYLGISATRDSGAAIIMYVHTSGVCELSCE